MYQLFRSFREIDEDILDVVENVFNLFHLFVFQADFREQFVDLEFEEIGLERA